MNQALRMLDANLNRAREALRVMEDVARFCLQSEDLCGRLKSLRHEVAAVAAGVGEPALLLAWRDTPGDVGTGISTEAEGRRSGLYQVAHAACKRLTEALRVIEECLKMPGVSNDTGLARRVEQVRYASYEVEKRLLLAMGGGVRARQWGVCVLVTESACKRPWQEVVRGAIAGGAECLQLREKELGSAELLGRACALVEIARPAGVAVIINDRADIALLAGADGVHVGQEDVPVWGVRKLAGEGLLVGVSTHDLREARAAAEDGADYCGVGAMFPTATKPRVVSGPGYLREYLADAQVARLPYLAIGGITLENVGQLRSAGCAGVAVCAAVCGSADPAGATAALVAAVRGG